MAPVFPPSRTVKTNSVTPAPAKGVSFFTPAQDPPAGTALSTQDGQPIPKLFTPLKIRGVELPNRIWVSPMCQYSAHEGFHTPWHLTHYGGIAQRGPGVIMVEATAVQARGRITPEDSGIWQDAQIEGHAATVEFVHSQNGVAAIQLAHSGRKASTTAPFLPAGIAAADVGGWADDVVAPSAIAYDAQNPTPRAISLDEIAELRRDFVSAAKRSLAAGYDVIELHMAHGYLLSTFLSPATNKRTDKYGGSFENRVRLALELVEDVRAAIPESTPLWVRISGTDWLDNNPEWKGESWTVEQSVELAKLFAERGVDVLDVSSGGIHPMQKVNPGPGYQAFLAKHIKKAVGDRILISTVGSIKDGHLAQELIAGGKDADDAPLDLIAAGRMFQKNPGLVWAWADDLGVTTSLAHQIGWGFGGRHAKVKDSAKQNLP
ncbi:2,4-dienoyl-CoA reductase or related NADH-dependent reductase, Old Yellow Enzyme (OYE) family [Geosmithia morbida]|uniref:2,4-dienoyl-CoA reductase or related NADH-dependent reductase, Old Yellow Enzyme (OYE) family n=1 Tax=Geosmithia morbida TaxID=1094350 RepID=A0A9P5D5B5_9HYPO|nr:2,4-dienoyl-CoA reductase or related NADH-dependent reductase, Old Yellow Enzyme (OYE) family [Geosmithia morbida]KAF4127022.1 2,4-dienoyl-CoA reductase or related NADH-dependent reductase, Old Yellow Enzyme (OYE) family [Geosmithia morbida]